MPREIIRIDGHDSSRSLGFLANAWIEHFVVHGPGDVQGEPVVHGQEFYEFVVDCYALDDNGRRLYDSAFFSRPKGADKSGLGARLALFEALGPCRFDGWAEGGEIYEDPWGLGFRYEYQPGEPLGRPVRSPMIRCMATEEGQTGNVYATVYVNLTDDDAPLSHVPGVDAGVTFVTLPDGGQIIPSTASAAAKDGGKETFVVFDEALALDTPLRTPAGWTTVGEVKVGDWLIGSNGEPVRVVKVTETFTDRDCYRVTFRDGASVITSQGHLWLTKVNGSGALPKIRTTAEMAAAGRRFAVPSAEPWNLPTADLPIDPYVLGAWLGDGDSANAVITSSVEDIDELIERLGQRGYTARRINRGRAPGVYVSVPGSHRNRFSPVQGLKVRLAAAGLLGAKRIPEEYLAADESQRLALLQGLMDTDGHVTPTGHASFVNSNPAIVDGIMRLLWSLGETPVRSWTADKRSRSGGYWRVTFTPRNVVPFALRRKVERCRTTTTTRDLWRTIRSIERVDTVPTRCIGVDAPDHLFVAGETSIVTHNTHLYNDPELRRMYATVTRNLRKRKRNAGTWYLETTTMFAPGEDSVAEGTYQLAENIRAGKARRGRLLFDHRWGECEDLSRTEQLHAAILEAFGEAIEWNDVEAIIDEFYDPRKTTADSRRYFLNAPTTTADAWIAPHTWAARTAPHVSYLPIVDGDTVVLGFDGSRRRSRAVTDATALIGCRVSDGHVFQIAVWQQPDGPDGVDWQVPTELVDAAVAQAFKRFRVVGFFADPAKWESYVAQWEAAYGKRLKVKASRDHPIQWWMTGGRASQIVKALEQFESAVIDGELTHDGAYELTAHVQNARRRTSRVGVQIAKEHPESARKIDAAIAAVLAWQARLAAISAGVSNAPKRSMPRRLR